MTLKSDAKFEEKMTCCFENDRNSPEHSKVSKLDPFVQSRKCMTLKFTEELCVMTMKNDTKIEEELTVLKLTWGTSRILTWAFESQKNCVLIGYLWPKYILSELQKYRGVIYLSWHWRGMQILKKNWLVVWKKTWEF